MKKNLWVTLIIIVAVITFAIILMNRSSAHVSKETTQCIAENSELYVQLGCHTCEIQEEMFGNNYEYLNTIDCFYEGDKCSDIQSTPTWVIKGEIYEKVLSIEKLEELTGC